MSKASTSKASRLHHFGSDDKRFLDDRNEHSASVRLMLLIERLALSRRMIAHPHCFANKLNGKTRNSRQDIINTAKAISVKEFAGKFRYYLSLVENWSTNPQAAEPYSMKMHRKHYEDFEETALADFLLFSMDHEEWSEEILELIIWEVEQYLNDEDKERFRTWYDDGNESPTPLHIPDKCLRLVFSLLASAPPMRHSVRTEHDFMTTTEAMNLSMLTGELTNADTVSMMKRDMKGFQFPTVPDMKRILDWFNRCTDDELPQLSLNIFSSHKYADSIINVVRPCAMYCVLDLMHQGHEIDEAIAMTRSIFMRLGQNVSEPSSVIHTMPILPYSTCRDMVLKLPDFIIDSMNQFVSLDEDDKYSMWEENIDIIQTTCMPMAFKALSHDWSTNSINAEMMMDIIRILPDDSEGLLDETSLDQAAYDILHDDRIKCIPDFLYQCLDTGEFDLAVNVVEFVSFMTELAKTMVESGEDLNPRTRYTDASLPPVEASALRKTLELLVAGYAPAFLCQTICALNSSNAAKDSGRTKEKIIRTWEWTGLAEALGATDWCRIGATIDWTA